ncbi:unnamed protein product [Cladocopium goreaui]|uniref:E3 ubiquitin-protein ligase RNF12-B n=1 Tax=Cladocopium goreaui TaxID=2562237 RepID=A0A9P1G295_9DINO|nr:unnamed protein product [Cladocopium goreaui]
MAEVVSLQLEEDQSGEEAMMQDFVRLHMMSMLQPFAERVQVIQEHVKLLQDAQHQSLGQVKHLEGCSAAQSEELQKLSEEVQRHKEQLEAQQLELATVKKERNRLEGNHEITKASVAKAREMAEELAELVEKLREQQKGSMEKLELCHTEWQELDKRLVERFDTRLDKQGRVCKELQLDEAIGMCWAGMGWNEKQLELQKLLQQAKSSGDRACLCCVGTHQFSGAPGKRNHLSLSLEALKEGLETSSRGHQAAAHELREELEGLKEELLQRSKAWADTNREAWSLVLGFVFATCDWPAGEAEKVIRDYLYRAKSHATWVIPSFDFDEYFHLNSGNIFPDGKIPQDYLRHEAHLQERLGQPDTVEDLDPVGVVNHYRVPDRDPLAQTFDDKLVADAHLQERLGQPDTVEALPKYVYNVHLANDAWWHWLKDFDPKTKRSSVIPMTPDMMATVVSSVPTEHISLNESIGYVHHYRIPHGDPQAKTYDDHLVSDNDKLTEAIERRFGQKLPALLKRFSEAIPQPAQ